VTNDPRSNTYTIVDQGRKEGRKEGRNGRKGTEGTEEMRMMVERERGIERLTHTAVDQGREGNGRKGTEGTESMRMMVERERDKGQCGGQNMYNRHTQIGGKIRGRKAGR
jgi:hypothetical protein